MCVCVYARKHPYPLNPPPPPPKVVEELRLTKLELERAAQEKMAVIVRLAKAEATGG